MEGENPGEQFAVVLASSMFLFFALPDDGLNKIGQITWPEEKGGGEEGQLPSEGREDRAYSSLSVSPIHTLSRCPPQPPAFLLSLLSLIYDAY